jgi:L-ascorbate metabolism protein UlaG (beta-lactamase superfamily)
MRVVAAAAAILLALAAASASASEPPRATFIGNMGVHLSDGTRSLLVDFPYRSGAFGYMEWPPEAVPQGVAGLCLFTHSHADHFEAALASRYCERVLGPRDAVRASGVSALEMSDEVRWNAVVIRPLRTPHAGLEHYSYVVEWGGARLYFTGDTEDPSTLLAQRGLDGAFVSPWLLGSVREQGARIDARQVIVYHHRGGEVVPEDPPRIVPRQGELLSFPAAKRD